MKAKSFILIGAAALVPAWDLMAGEPGGLLTPLTSAAPITLQTERRDRLQNRTTHPSPLPFRRGEGESSPGLSAVHTTPSSVTVGTVQTNAATPRSWWRTLFFTNAPTLPSLQTNQAPGVLRHALTNGVPGPGVYETEPYTCIVVVPGAHPDDRMVKGLSGPVPFMPQVTPELRWIPRTRIDSGNTNRQSRR